MSETKYFETENGLAIGQSVLIKDDQGKATFSDVEIATPRTLQQLLTALYHYFNNTDTPFMSENVQGAIVEALTLSGGAIRIPDVGGYNGNAGTGKWLERFASIPSNDGPLVIPDARKLIGLSLTVGSLSTGTVTVFKNPRGTPVSIATISVNNSLSETVTGLDASLAHDDEIGYQITSGSMSKPLLVAELQKIIT